MMMKSFFICVLLTVSTFLIAQVEYQKGYFRSPVDHTIRVSGSFAELRPNHFHAGLDIKPNPKGGKNYIYAVADGYISRINIKESGYGQAVYIAHDNGYTSVYVHLDKLSEKLESYIKDIQYQKKSFVVNEFPAAYAVPIKKGEIIGVMGNKGRSFGKHLHFEIRETDTEKTVNPLLFDFPVEDARRPYINGIYLYALDTDRETISKKYYPTKKINDNTYHINIAENHIRFGAWRTGIAVRTYDYFTGAANLNGVYSIKMHVDDLLSFEYNAEKFSFDETRYLNAHIDYDLKKRKGNYFNRCFLLKGNQLSMYESVHNDGVIPLYKDKPQRIKITVSDARGNDVHLVFNISRATNMLPQDLGSGYNYIVYHDTPFSFLQEDMGMEMEAGSVYNNTRLTATSTPSTSTTSRSKLVEIGTGYEPIHKPVKLKIKPTGGQLEKLVARYGSSKSPSFFTGKFTGEFFEIETKYLGKYRLEEDLLAPTLRSVTFRSDMRNQSSFGIQVKDDKSGVATYNGYVDGNWILIEYDEKNDLLRHDFDGKITPGNHTFRLEVTDAVGNQKVYERKFLK